MKQDAKIDEFETTLMLNLWAERYNFVIILIVVAIAIYAQFSIYMFIKLLLLSFLTLGIIAFGFVGIAAHIRYYFDFERKRKVLLYSDRMVIIQNRQVVRQLFRNDITEIILHDRLRTSESNFVMTLMDSYYYLEVIDKAKETEILTCLLDISLKKKIAAWFGQKLKHEYQFFPFPKRSAVVR
jgi:hypothetical protein